MSLQVIPPHFDSSKNCYSFTFQNAPVFEETTTNPAILVITEEDLTEFVTEFLLQASKYFSKPLEISLFFRRIAHEYDTSAVELKNIMETGDTFRASWIPARITFYTNRYILHWTLCELESQIISSTIPSGFLDEPVVEDTKSELPEVPLVEENQDAIPFGGIPPAEKEVKGKERKQIRQARLRAALAKFRAERLAERYYKRYGNFDWGNSDSELSSGSDLENQSRKI